MFVKISKTIIMTLLLMLLLSGCNGRMESEPISVIFEDGQGNVIITLDVQTNQSLTFPSQPVREGYQFLGWYYDNQPVSPTLLIDQEVPSEVRIVARWEVMQKTVYQLRFVNELAGETVEKTFEEGASFTWPTLEAQRHTFLGWKYQGELVNQAQFFRSTRPLTLEFTAAWEAIEPLYVITFIDEKTDLRKVLEIFDPSDFTFPKVETYEGYDFLGWHYNDVKFREDSLIDFTGPSTFELKGLWEMLAVILEVELVNTITGEVTTITQVEGEAIEPLDPLTLEGYTFVGWYLDEEGTEAYDDQPVVEGMSVYALFEPIPPVYIDTIIIHPLDDELIANKTYQLSWVISPSAVDHDEVTFTSSNQDVLTVDEKGNVVFLKAGTADITVRAVSGSVQQQITLTSNQFGVFSQANLDRALELRLSETLLIMTHLEELTIEGPLTLDFNGHRVDHLSITFQGAGSVHLKGEGTIRHNLTINAPSASILNEVRVQGTTVIERVGMTTYSAQSDHRGGITMKGSGHLSLSDEASKSDVTVVTDERVLLSGTFDNTVKITAKEAWVQLNGTVQHLQVEQGATLHVVRGSTIESLALGSTETVKVYVEEGSDVSGLENQPNVTLVKMHRIHVQGYSVSSTFGNYLLVEKGTLLTTLERQVTRNGHDFLGWFVDADFQTRFNFNTPINEDLTLYAQWRVHTFNVRFEGTSIVEPTVTVDYNQRLSTLPTPTRSGHTFLGWFTDNDHTVRFSISTRITEHTSLYGAWRINQYQVRFNSQGGSSVASQMVDYQSRLETVEDPTREGYHFRGWFKDSDFTERFFFTQMITEDKTLYAQWGIKTYTVQFNTRGGSAKSNQVVEHNQRLDLEDEPSLNYHTFEGWYLDEELTTPFNSSTRIIEGFTLYARWEEDTTLSAFPVYFNHTNLPYQLVDRGDAVELPDNPTRSGYAFEGWYADETLTTPFDPATPVTRITQLYANWRKLQNNVFVVDVMSQNNDQVVIAIKLTEDVFLHGYDLRLHYDGSLLSVVSHSALSGTVLNTTEADVIKFNRQSLSAIDKPMTIFTVTFEILDRQLTTIELDVIQVTVIKDLPIETEEYAIVNVELFKD